MNIKNICRMKSSTLIINYQFNKLHSKINSFIRWRINWIYFSCWGREIRDLPAPGRQEADHNFFAACLPAVRSVFLYPIGREGDPDATKWNREPRRGSKRTGRIRRLSDLDLLHLREKEKSNCAQRRRDAKASGRQARSKNRETRNLPAAGRQEAKNG